MSDNYIKDKDKNQILAELHGTAEPSSVIHEQQKMAIFVRCTEDLEIVLNKLIKSMNDNADINSKLSKKIFWLSIVLTSATVIISLIAILTFFK